MKYIVSKLDETLQKNLSSQIKQKFKAFGAVLELTDKEVVSTKEKMITIEPDYELMLGPMPITSIEGITHLPIMIATIGDKMDSTKVSYHYDLSSHIWEEKDIKKQQIPWICCYSEAKWIYASDYLTGIDKLHQIAKELKRTLVIIGHVESRLPYFKYHSFTQEIVNLYLETYKSIYINGVDKSEIYHYEYQCRKKSKCHEARMIYTAQTESEIKSLIKKWFTEKIEVLVESNHPMLLYQDNFYDRIPLNQRIYVPLNDFDNKACSYYQELGLRTISLGRNYTFIYDERQKIDVLGKKLAHHILPNYISPILTPAPIQKEAIGPLNHCKRISQDLKYLGENVYIGIIGTQGIDYRKSYLRNELGETRVACIWKQEEGNQGTYYTALQINEALSASSPGEKVPLPENEENETLVLQIAGGKDKQHEGVATRAEFVVANINSAPKAINEIYGGIESEENVLMPDVLIAVHKLMEIAQLNNRPLVLYMPYNTNISAHDGSSILEQMLSFLGSQPGCTFIIPSGEEGDKKHHSTLIAHDHVLKQVSLQVKEQTPYLVGIIYMKHIQHAEFSLYAPAHKACVVKLEEKAVTNKEEITVYSTGVLDDYNNGSQYILFSIKNMTPGTWTIKMKEEASIRGTIDLWLSEEQLNANVTLKPAIPYTTMGSNAAIDGGIGVTSFDSRNLVVLGGAGRGFDWNSTANSICASAGVSSIPSSDGNWKLVQGTTIAASTLLGVIACLYDKWQVETDRAMANSFIMRQLIFSHLEQLQDINYPDRSQGHGIFQLEMLPQLLGTPIR